MTTWIGWITILPTRGDDCGRVCTNEPVHAGYLDTVAWDHTTGLLADPSLIRTGIDNRLAHVHSSDPAVRQREPPSVADVGPCRRVLGSGQA